MINIFDYTDFIEYLKHFCEDAKKRRINLSYRSLAEQAGFGNRWALYRVLYKKTALSPAQIAKLSIILKHTKREAEYFYRIIDDAQHGSANEGPRLLNKKQIVNKNAAAKPQLIGKNGYGYFSEWYHSVIRALVAIGAFNDDYALLGSKLIPPISTLQVKKSVELLMRFKFIERDDCGKYRIMTAKNITIGTDFTQEEKNRFHRMFIEIARENLLDHSSPKQKTSSLVLGISEETYKIICKRIEKLKEQILTLVENETQADQVFLFQPILVPLTNKPTEKQRKESSL